MTSPLCRYVASVNQALENVRSRGLSIPTNFCYLRKLLSINLFAEWKSGKILYFGVNFNVAHESWAGKYHTSKENNIRKILVKTFSFIPELNRLLPVHARNRFSFQSGRELKI